MSPMTYINECKQTMVHVFQQNSRRFLNNYSQGFEKSTLGQLQILEDFGALESFHFPDYHITITSQWMATTSRSSDLFWILLEALVIVNKINIKFIRHVISIMPFSSPYPPHGCIRVDDFSFITRLTNMDFSRRKKKEATINWINMSFTH